MADRLLPWKPLCSSTITLEACTAFDAYGAPSAYGTAASYTARVSWQQQKVTKQNGEDAVARGSVIVMGTPTVGIYDRLTLEDDSHPPILSISRVCDEEGELYVKLFIG